MRTKAERRAAHREAKAFGFLSPTPKSEYRTPRLYRALVRAHESRLNAAKERRLRAVRALVAKIERGGASPSVARASVERWKQEFERFKRAHAIYDLALYQPRLRWTPRQRHDQVYFPRSKKCSKK